MKLMIASDIHGSALYCRKMLEAYKREEAGPASSSGGHPVSRSPQ